MCIASYVLSAHVPCALLAYTFLVVGIGKQDQIWQPTLVQQTHLLACLSHKKSVQPKSGPLGQFWLPKMVPPDHFWLAKMVPLAKSRTKFGNQNWSEGLLLADTTLNMHTEVSRFLSLDWIVDWTAGLDYWTDLCTKIVSHDLHRIRCVELGHMFDA